MSTWMRSYGLLDNENVAPLCDFAIKLAKI
jgi:hypothetical protein